MNTPFCTSVKNSRRPQMLLASTYVVSQHTWKCLFAHAGPQRVQQVPPPHVLLWRAADRELTRLRKDFHHTDQRSLLFWYSGRASSFVRLNQCRNREERSVPQNNTHTHKHTHCAAALKRYKRANTRS